MAAHACILPVSDVTRLGCSLHIIFCRPMGESAAGDEALVAAARNGVGPNVSLLVDAACVWPDARTALARAKAFEPYDLFLLEEPLHPDDIDGYVWCACVYFVCREVEGLQP